MRRSTILLVLILAVRPILWPEVSGVEAQSEKTSLRVSQELDALFKADQADRNYQSLSSQQIEVAKARDAQRTLRVRAIVQKETLETAQDYVHAAAILQHGLVAEDFITAHILATIAGYKGSSVGKWLAAAALDRYLQFIGRAQVFGTQGLKEPYDKTVISDTIRKLHCVLPLNEQHPSVSSRLADCQ
jgi:hypothetical protein